VETLLLVRHAHARSNAAEVTSGVPPGEGLTPTGLEQARALRDALAGADVALGASSRLLRARQTLQLVVEGRAIPVIEVPELDEIAFGAYDGLPVAEYRRWAWTAAADADCPGGGESRAAVAARTARALEVLLGRPEQTIVAVGHALPLRYVLDGARDLVPKARIEPVPHATALQLGRDDVVRARALLAEWAGAARFRE
jgi:broad specificity phosphatase PhoE